MSSCARQATGPRARFAVFAHVAHRSLYWGAWVTKRFSTHSPTYLISLLATRYANRLFGPWLSHSASHSASSSAPALACMLAAESNPCTIELGSKEWLAMSTTGVNDSSSAYNRDARGGEDHNGHVSIPLGWDQRPPPCLVRHRGAFQHMRTGVRAISMCIGQVTQGMPP